MSFEDYLKNPDLYQFFLLDGMSFHWADHPLCVQAKNELVGQRIKPIGHEQRWEKTFWLRLGHRQHLTTYGEIIRYFVKEMMIPLHLAGKDLHGSKQLAIDEKHLEISHHSAHGPYQHFFAFRWVDRQDILFVLWQLLMEEQIPQRQFRLRIQPHHYTQSAYHWQQYLVQGMTIKGIHTAQEWQTIKQQGMAFPWGSFLQVDEFLKRQRSGTQTIAQQLGLKERIFDAAAKIKLRPESFNFIRQQAEALAQYSVHQSFSPPSVIVHWDDMIFIHQHLRQYLQELIQAAKIFVEAQTAAATGKSSEFSAPSTTLTSARKGLASAVLDLFNEKESNGETIVAPPLSTDQEQSA